MGFKRRYKNIVEKFLSGDQGKRFFQVFYNVGAAVVIIGALAKLNHWPFGLGNVLLTVGMITEFLVFLISAFDQPGRDYQWERVFPGLEGAESAGQERPEINPFRAEGKGNGMIVESGGNSGGGTVIIGGGSLGGGSQEKDNRSENNKADDSIRGSVFVGGGLIGNYGGGVPAGNSGMNDSMKRVDSESKGSNPPSSAAEAVAQMTPDQIRQSFGIPNAVGISEEDTNALTASIKKMATAADQLSKIAEMTEATQQYLDQVTTLSEDMKRFSEVTNSLNQVSGVLLNSYKSITDNSEGISQSSVGYVQQMEALNRNIQGLNTIYEIQLRSISSQISAIERINSGLARIKDLYEGSVVDSSIFRHETEKMAQQLQALNNVYNRLLNAMTMNMYGAGPAFTPPTT
ncbi:MAG: gliding motility protein GldL [Candidatus Azobacteroides sp.]|nr:gliding motility protein GldL [Candidatus Azobacteroides sp.]